MTLSRFRGCALSCVLIGATGGVPFQGADAQAYDTGGIQLSFGVAFRIEAQTNRGLDPVSAGTTYQASVPLSFGLLSETRASRLALDLGGALRRRDAPDGDGNDGGGGFESPSAGLSYDRSSASARFAFSASLQQTDLSETSVLSEDGLELVSGNATRRNTSVQASLNWRDDAPLGFGVLARISDIAYSDGTATDLDGSTLNDSRRRTLRATARADLNAATQLNLNIGYSDIETDGDPDRGETLSFGAGLALDRPLGGINVSFNVARKDGDNRINVGVGRSLSWPSGQLSARIGATRAANGGVSLTGSLDLARDLPRGSLNLGIARDVATSDETDSERLSTRVTLNYRYELTELSNLGLTLQLAQIEDTADDDTGRNATLNATYSYELDADWNLAAGYRHRYKKDADSDAARSNTVYLELRRGFVTRF